MKKVFSVIIFAIGLIAGFFICKYTNSDQPATIINQKPFAIHLRPSSGVNKASFLPSANSGVLPVTEAEKYLSNFKTAYPGSSISFSVDSADIAGLFNTKKCSGGLRIYFGVKDIDRSDSLTLMIAGIDGRRDNVFFDINSKDYLVDYTNPCPKDCPPIGNSTVYDRRSIHP